MSYSELILRGVRQNNLKNISLALPHDKVIAVTGVSGSGKSSLAFQTIFAEGQWRFIESLSTYARLFLEKLDRPDADAILNIRPAVALEQHNPVRGSRSTVGTLTEIYDYLRLVYSKAATPYCPGCGLEIRKWDPSSVAEDLKDRHSGARAMILFESPRPATELVSNGYMRAYRDGAVKDISSLDAVGAAPPYDIVLDRLIVKDDPRLSDSIETAMREGGGRVKIVIMDGPSITYTDTNACDNCGAGLPDPSPLLFSFNHPVGACPECKGFGNVLRYDRALIAPDPMLSLEEGAIEPFEKPAASWWRAQLMKGAKKSGINLKKPFNELPNAHRELLFKGNGNFYGVDAFFSELEEKRYKLHVRVFLSRYRKGVVCQSCGGRRLNKEALAFKISGRDIAEVSAMNAGDMLRFLDNMDMSPFKRGVAKEPLRQIRMKLEFLNRVGLNYLSMSREGKTLSGGEYQRVNLSTQLSSRLTGTLYVLDEPTVGLHSRDTERISSILKELAEAGNTVVMVEHDRSMIESAEWIVELGPGGGHKGGSVVFSGPIADFLKAETITSSYIKGTARPAAARTLKRQAKGKLSLHGASGHNLKNVDLDVPLGTMTVVSGVSGSGKSSLIVDTLYNALLNALRHGAGFPLEFKSIAGHERVRAVKLIDQAPIGRSPRSNPVTYLKAFDHIRRIFASRPEAKAHGYGPGFFSFNVPGGRCETCKGEGYQKLEMYFFEDLYVKCEDCGGSKYGHEALSVTYMGRRIDEVLDMTVEEAEMLFSTDKQLKSRFSLMRDIGLGYLRLGQPATTLSGGEAQRLKICAELGMGAVYDTLYILDEPTVGLHPRDVAALLSVLNRLVDSGNTVLIIEHNLDVIRHADWVIDMGPEGGDAGGGIIFAGRPDELATVRQSHTAKFLQKASPNGRVS